MIGGTGRTGRHVIPLALEKGYKIRFLTRNPNKCEFKEGVTIVNGSVRDPEAVRNLVRGTDAVISCLGTSRGEKEMVVAPGIQVIVDAMQKEKVKRLIHMSCRNQ